MGNINRLTAGCGLAIDSDEQMHGTLNHYMLNLNTEAAKQSGKIGALLTENVATGTNEQHRRQMRERGKWCTCRRNQWMQSIGIDGVCSVKLLHQPSIEPITLAIGVPRLRTIGKSLCHRIEQHQR